MADVPVNFTGKVSGINLTSQPGSPMESAYWAAWPWNDWIRKQIDYGVSVGAVTFRLIGDVTVVTNNLISQTVYNARTQQLAAYIVSLGCSMYYTGCATYGTDGTDNGTTALSDSTIASVINSNIGSITGVSGAPDYSANILGCDIVQEANANLSAGRVNNIYSLVKPNVKSPIGCTFSTTDTYPNTTWLNSIIGSCDYLDLHIYPQSYGINNQPTPSNINTWMANWPTKDFLFGEGGCGLNNTSGQCAAWLTGLAALGTMAGTHARGAMAWAVQDQNSSLNTQQYGFFDGSWTARTAQFLYPWVIGWGTAASPTAPTTPVCLHDAVILVSPLSCSTDYTGVKFFRNGTLVATNASGYFDDSANVVPGTQYTYTAKVTTGSHGDSAASNPLVFSLPPSRTRI
jgi:hypothetical protein